MILKRKGENMRLKWRSLFGVAGIVFLGICAVALAGRRQLKAGDQSQWVVPHTSNPPVIDGTIGQAEWKRAAAVSGVVDQGNDLLLPRPTTFYMAWDADNLYLACRTYLRPGATPTISAGRSPDRATASDAGLEMLFKPMGENVSHKNHRTAFKFNINALGHGGTYSRLALGQVMSNWGPQFDTATSITEPGSSPKSGRWLEMEVAFSTDDFELVGPNKAGDEWLVMLGFNHLPKWTQARIPSVGSYFTASGKSRIILAREDPYVQMTSYSLANLSSGRAFYRVDIINPGGKARQVELTMDVAEAIKEKEKYVLAPGATETFKIDRSLPKEVKNGHISLNVMSSGEPLLAYKAFFKRGYAQRILDKAKSRDPNDFVFKADFNPVREQLLVRADTYYLPNPETAAGLRYTVTKQDSGTVVAEGEIETIVEYYFDKLIDMPDLSKGKYAVTAEIIQEDGEVFGPRERTFTVLDPKADLPLVSKWYGKDYGDVDRVIPPFTAIEHKEGMLHTWGRAYRINSLGLPRQAMSQGKPLMASPGRIVVVQDGQTERIPVTDARITQVEDWRVRFAGSAEGAGLRFMMKGWLEQDGMVDVTLTYAPKGDDAVKLEALRIEYPYTNEMAECLLSIGPGNNFAAKTATVLDPKKQGRLWDTLDIGLNGSEMRQGSFYPDVWLGSEQRGMLWWADSDRGWFPVDAVPAHEVERTKEGVVLRNNIIGQPVELDESRTIHFTWMASPFKPLPEGWRSFMATDNGTFYAPFRGQRTNPETGKKYIKPPRLAQWIHPEDHRPEMWSKLWAEQKKKADTRVRRHLPFDPYEARTGVAFTHMSFQFLGYGPISMQDEVYDYFGQEWMAGGSKDTWNPTYIDYAMWLFNRAFGEGGVVSTYWDITFPKTYDYPLSGLGYRLPNGKIQPEYNSLNGRKFFQRLYSLQDQHGLNPGCTGCHSTNSYMLCALPWLSAVLDGERSWNLDASERDWIDFYPKERMRAMSVPHTWGVGICWMSNFDSEDPAKINEYKCRMAEYVWMFDMWKNPYMHPAYHMKSMPCTILDWGLNDDTVTYHPYWRNPYARTPHKNVLVSLWRIPDEADGRVIVGIFNYSDERKNLRVNVDLEKLGLAGRSLVVRDLYKDYAESRAATRRGKGQFIGPHLSKLGSDVRFNPRKGTLRIKDLGTHRGRFIGIGAETSKARRRAMAHFPHWADTAALGKLSDLGFFRPDTRYMSGDETDAVMWDVEGLEVTLWALPHRVFFAVHNNGEEWVDCRLKLDLDRLGLRPEKKWQQFLRVRDLEKEAAVNWSANNLLNYYKEQLNLGRLAAGDGRLIVLRRY